MNNNIVYSTDTLVIKTRITKKAHLQTDTGLFLDETNNIIGKVVYVYRNSTVDGTIYYTTKYPVVKQYTSENSFLVWKFNGVTYELEQG